MLKLATEKGNRFNNSPGRGTYNTPRHANCPKVMTAEQTARLLGVCHKTLINMVKSGVIPCRKTGRKYLFSVEVIERWIKGEPTADGEGVR